MLKTPLFVVRPAVAAWVVLGAALVAVSPAAAQAPPLRPRPERPYRGLFGGGPGTADQSLIFDFRAGVGYDDDLLAEAFGATTPVDGRQPNAGSFGSMSLGLSYGQTRENWSFNANYGGQARYYPHERRKYLTSHGVGAGVSFTPNGTTQLTFNSSLTYQPYYAQRFFPAVYEFDLGPVLVSPPTMSETRESYFVMSNGVGFSHPLTRRAAVYASYSSERNGVLKTTDYQNQSAGAGFTYAIGKGLAGRAGYSLTEGRYDIDGRRERVRYSSFTGGLDFNKALSLTRRTFLRFSTGMSAANDGTETHYTMTGNVGLTREIGRTWNAGIVFVRDFGLSPYFPEPMLTDSVSAQVGGLINRRLQLTFVAGATRGAIGFSDGDNSVTSASAGSSLMVGFTESTGLSLNYMYYRHLYGADVALPLGSPRHMNRQSVSVNFAYTVPLYERRRPNAAR